MALDVGVVQGEVCAPEAAWDLLFPFPMIESFCMQVQEAFMEDMEPLFDAYASCFAAPSGFTKFKECSY